MQEKRKIIRRGVNALVWAIANKASKRMQNGTMNGFGLMIHRAIERKSEESRLQFSREWFKIEPLKEKRL
jgi:hypothetical protein